MIEKYLNDRYNRPCSSTSLGSDEVEDNFGDEDETTQLEFEQFKRWLDAGSPASKIPHADDPAPSKQLPVETVTTSAAPGMVADLNCSKCGRKECNLTFYYGLCFERLVKKLMNPLFHHKWMAPSNLY